MTKGLADQDDGFLSRERAGRIVNGRRSGLPERHVSPSCRDAGAGIRLMLSASRRSFRCMKLRSIVAVSVVALAVVACGPQEGGPAVDGTWVGTIATQGNVTTVVNESGSVWGGTATLVEEASIGVEAGAAEYMFGEIAAVYASAERIYLADAQIPIRTERETRVPA